MRELYVGDQNAARDMCWSIHTKDDFTALAYFQVPPTEPSWRAQYWQWGWPNTEAPLHRRNHQLRNYGLSTYIDPRDGRYVLVRYGLEDPWPEAFCDFSPFWLTGVGDYLESRDDRC